MMEGRGLMIKQGSVTLSIAIPSQGIFTHLLDWLGKYQQYTSKEDEGICLFYVTHCMTSCSKPPHTQTSPFGVFLEFTGKSIVSKHLSKCFSVFSCLTEKPLTFSGAVHCAVTFSDLKKPRRGDFSLWTMTQPSKFTVINCCPLRTISQTCLNNYIAREGNHSLPIT